MKLLSCSACSDSLGGTVEALSTTAGPVSSCLLWSLRTMSQDACPGEGRGFSPPEQHLVVTARKIVRVIMIPTPEDALIP